MDLMYVANPTRESLDHIRLWLEEEQRETGHSFLCNWNVIEEDFNAGRFACAELNGTPVSFFTWGTCNRVVDGHIAATRIDLRGRGIGRRFIAQALDALRMRGAAVMTAECAPPESESFWRLHGFVSYPAGHPQRLSQSIWLYKILVDSEPPIEHSEGHVLELWDEPPYGPKRSDPPVIRWRLAPNATGQLEKPLVFPCDPDWRVRILRDGQSVFAGKLKQLVARRYREDGFLVLDTLPSSNVIC